MWPSKNIIQVLEHSPEPFIVYSHLYSQLENRLTAGCLQVTARTRTTTADRYTAHGLHSKMQPTLDVKTLLYLLNGNYCEQLVHSNFH